ELPAAVDAAGAQEALLLLVPALAGDRLAGEVKDGVAAGDLVAPRAGLRRVGLHRLHAGLDLAAAAHADDLVAAGEEGAAEGPSDEAAGAGDEDSHRPGLYESAGASTGREEGGELAAQVNFGIAHRGGERFADGEAASDRRREDAAGAVERAGVDARRREAREDVAVAEDVDGLRAGEVAAFDED